MPKKTLIDVKGLSDAKVDKMLEAACKLLPAVQAGGFVTAGEWIVMVRAPQTFFSFFRHRHTHFLRLTIFSIISRYSRPSLRLRLFRPPRTPTAAAQGQHQHQDRRGYP